MCKTTCIRDELARPRTTQVLVFHSPSIAVICAERGTRLISFAIHVGQRTGFVKFGLVPDCFTRRHEEILRNQSGPFASSGDERPINARCLVFARHERMGRVLLSFLRVFVSSCEQNRTAYTGTFKVRVVHSPQTEKGPPRQPLFLFNLLQGEMNPPIRPPACGRGIKA